VRLFLSFFFFLFAVDVQAQIGLSSTGIVSGKVVDATTGDPLVAVSIVNVATQAGTYTDDHGQYSIRAKTGEQLSASSLGYKTETFAVSDGSNYIQRQVSLTRLNYNMNEFIVRPKYSPYQADSIQRASTYERTLIRRHEGSVMSPVSFLAEKISRKSKAMFRFQKDFARMEDERFIDTRYGAEVVTQMTGLTGDTLANFMNAYPMPYDFARGAGELETKMWIRTNYREWLAKERIKAGKPDTLSVKKP
jgi:hypothetical protein